MAKHFEDMTAKEVVEWLDGVCEGHDYPKERSHLRKEGHPEVFPGSFRRNCSYCWYALRQGVKATDG